MTAEDTEGADFLVMGETVFVSDYSYRRGERVFSELNAGESGFRFVSVDDTDEEAVAARIREEGVRAIICTMRNYTGPLYEALPRGGVIARFGVGHDSIDKVKATAHGLWVTNTPGVLENGVAEHGVFMMGMLARQLTAQCADMKEGRWIHREGLELRGRPVAIIGFGRIGRKLGQKAVRGFEMEVIGCGRASPEEFASRNGRTLEELRAELGFAEYTNDIASAVGRAEFVVICAAATPETRHLVDRKFLSRMREGAFLVNTARGSLVNEDDLYDALATGRLAGAALDVFEEEPYVPACEAKDLRTLANVILTPHIASHTEESNDAIARCAAQTVMVALTEGVEGLENVVNRGGN